MRDSAIYVAATSALCVIIWSCQGKDGDQDGDAPPFRESTAQEKAEEHKCEEDPIAIELQSKNPNRRIETVKRLSETEGQHALEHLIKALKDPDPTVRWFAADGLGKKKDARVLDALVSAFADAVPDVRSHAAHVLGRMSEPKAVDPLLGLLKDESAKVRQQAIMSLVILGGEGTVEALIKHAEVEREATCRIELVQGFSTLRDPRTIKTLERFLNDEEEAVRFNARVALNDMAGRPPLEGCEEAK